MLAEPSITTATTFSRSRTRSTINTGCQSITSTVASSSVCSVPRITLRHHGRFFCRYSVNAKNARPTTVRATSTHSGQGFANDSSPARYAKGEYLNKSSNTPDSSVAHRIDEVVDGVTIRERRERLRITRVIGVLPGVPEVHVEIDGHGETTVFVMDSSPVRSEAVLLPRATAHRAVDARD